LHLVKAHSVMTPIAAYRQAFPLCDFSRLPQTSPDTDIDALIGLTIGADLEPLAVVEHGVVVGIITAKDLLRGVQGIPNEAHAVAPVLETTP
jgi:glycine betaine/proline transport system ATP-binding protein